jgi:hypothetical protein
MEFSNAYKEGGPFAWSPDGSMVASCDNAKMTVKETSTLMVVNIFCNLDMVSKLEWSPDEKYILCKRLHAHLFFLPSLCSLLCVAIVEAVTSKQCSMFTVLPLSEHEMLMPTACSRCNVQARYSAGVGRARPVMALQDRRRAGWACFQPLGPGRAAHLECERVQCAHHSVVPHKLCGRHRVVAVSQVCGQRDGHQQGQEVHCSMTPNHKFS